MEAYKTNDKTPHLPPPILLHISYQALRHIHVLRAMEVPLLSLHESSQQVFLQQAPHQKEVMNSALFRTVNNVE